MQAKPVVAMLANHWACCIVKAHPADEPANVGLLAGLVVVGGHVNIGLHKSTGIGFVDAGFIQAGA